MGIDIDKIKSQKSSVNDKQKRPSTRIQDILNTDLSLNKGFSDKNKARFFSEFAVLLNSGLDLNSVLEIIIEGSSKKKEGQLFSQIKMNILNGESLSEAIKKTGKFNNFEFFTLKIGEESGKVGIVLNDLANYYSRKVEQRRKIFGMLSYPIIVLFIAIGAVIFMLNFIVPMFEEVFLSFGGELPALTRMVLLFSELISKYSYLLLIIGLISLLVISTQRKKLWFKKYSSRLLLKIPYVNTLLKKIYISRLCHSFYLLSLSKNPLLNSIRLVKQLISFYPLNTSLSIIEQDLVSGSTLHQSMSKLPFFDKKVVSLIKVGEEVNMLETIFHQLDLQYQNEIDHQAQVISNLLEPFLIIFVGGLVAIILIAMYLPLFNLGNNAF